MPRGTYNRSQLCVGRLSKLHGSFRQWTPVRNSFIYAGFFVTFIAPALVFASQLTGRMSLVTVLDLTPHSNGCGAKSLRSNGKRRNTSTSLKFQPFSLSSAAEPEILSSMASASFQWLILSSRASCSPKGDPHPSASTGCAAALQQFCSRQV